MIRRVTARYSGKAFVPESPCDVPDGSLVDLVIDVPAVTPPTITDSAERAAALRRLVQRMKAHLLAPGRTRLSRDQLHERG